jgi:hypothetical protein
MAAPVKPAAERVMTTVGSLSAMAGERGGVGDHDLVGAAAQDPVAVPLFAGLASTVAPRAWAAETMIAPTPPLAPSTRTVSSAATWASSVTARHAVTPATPIAAACSSATPSGTSISAACGTTAAVAHSPSRAVPMPWPRARTGRPSTVPAPSVPNVRGTGASGATRPAAACMSTGLIPGRRPQGQPRAHPVRRARHPALPPAGRARSAGQRLHAYTGLALRLSRTRCGAACRRPADRRGRGW